MHYPLAATIYDIHTDPETALRDLDALIDDLIDRLPLLDDTAEVLDLAPVTRATNLSPTRSN